MTDGLVFCFRYGKPLAKCHPLVRRLFARRFFTFSGQTRKVAYEGGLEGVALVPIQAVTAVCCTSTALADAWLFLRGAYGAALIVAIGVTQIWRLVSEFLRADHRGPGKITAYQVMAVLAVAATVALVTLAESVPPTRSNVVAGLRTLYDPIAIVSLQVLWFAVLWWAGRSWVTESILQF